jgi:hypothetical protein
MYNPLSAAISNGLFSCFASVSIANPSPEALKEVTVFTESTSCAKAKVLESRRSMVVIFFIALLFNQTIHVY